MKPMLHLVCFVVAIGIGLFVFCEDKVQPKHTEQASNRPMVLIAKTDLGSNWILTAEDTTLGEIPVGMNAADFLSSFPETKSLICKSIAAGQPIRENDVLEAPRLISKRYPVGKRLIGIRCNDHNLSELDLRAPYGIKILITATCEETHRFLEIEGQIHTIGKNRPGAISGVWVAEEEAVVIRRADDRGLSFDIRKR